MKKKEKLQSVLVIVLGIAIIFVIGFIGTIFFVSNSNHKTIHLAKTEKKEQNDMAFSADNEKFTANNFQVTRDSALSKKKQVNLEEEENMPSEYVIADSDVRPLTENDLKGLTKEELSYARNEIYARHGRIFHTESLKNYFESKSWYIPIYEEEDFPEEELTECEKDNTKLILNYEKKKGYQ